MMTFRLNGVWEMGDSRWDTLDRSGTGRLDEAKSRWSVAWRPDSEEGRSLARGGAGHLVAWGQGVLCKLPRASLVLPLRKRRPSAKATDQRFTWQPPGKTAGGGAMNRRDNRIKTPQTLVTHWIWRVQEKFKLTLR